jgi:hypothetical protein
MDDIRYKTLYEAGRRKRIAAGTWQPFVDDLAEVRAHIEAHARTGVGTRQLAALAGVGRQSVQTVRTGRGRPCGRMQRAVVDKILAVPLGVDQAATKALVDATGAHRRIHALCALGYGYGAQGRLVGWTRANWGNIICRPRIMPSTVGLVCTVYDQLSMTVPPPGYATSRALSTARRHGWPPPLAWDDDTIDDPTGAH